MSAPLVAIVGPTASGKSELGLALAERLGGEIVCCDSVQVYRGLDVGSGKPTVAERARVPHHALDLVDPDQPFDAAAWVRVAAPAIDAIAGAGRPPVVVGGTGLYFRALVDGLFEAPPPDPAIRERHRNEAAALGVPALHARLAGIDPEAAARINANDLVRISRALEVAEQTGRPITELWRAASVEVSRPCFVVRFDLALDELRARIDRRVDAMMTAGFLDEVKALRARGYAQARALGSLGYRELARHLDGATSLADAVTETKRATVAYARRQRTWFRKHEAAVSLRSPPYDDAIGDLAERLTSWWRTVR